MALRLWRRLRLLPALPWALLLLFLHLLLHLRR
jgi:hypothetical protein